MSEKEKIVALYVRVSTGYQVDKDSLPFQKKELKNYCEHVLHLDKKRIEVFEDAGKSGKNTKRPAFERMMEKVKSGQVSHVIVYKIDRISRNLVDFSLMYDDFKYNNVTFISLNEQFDTSSAIGEAILKIILVFAELERTDLAGIADDSLQETMDLLYGRPTNIWSSSLIAKESQDNENKKSKLKENLQKTDRALERLKKAYLFDDDGMDEKEFLEMKSKLEIDRVKIENEIKDIDNDAIANNVNQIDFIKTASQFLIIHKINSGEFIDYRSLAILDEESMKAFMNSVIDHIVVLNRQITEIVFKNGLSHKLLYR